MTPDTPTLPADARRQARLWLARVHGGEADAGALRRWLDEATEHAEAYAEAEALWRLSEGPARRLAAEEGDTLQAYLDAMSTPAPRVARRNPRAWLYPLASAACLLLMLWAGGWWQPGDRKSVV